MADDKKVKPIITANQTPELQEMVTPFMAHPGEVHVIRVDPAGKEIPGSDFSTSERTYNRSYKDKPGFMLKKSQTTQGK